MMALFPGPVRSLLYEDPDHPVTVQVIGIERRKLDANDHGPSLCAILVDEDGFTHSIDIEKVELTPFAGPNREPRS